MLADDVGTYGIDLELAEVRRWSEVIAREKAVAGRVIAELPPAYRAVVLLRDIEELSTEETAEALGLSVPAVKSRLLRARLALREKLTRQFKRKGEDMFAYL